MARSRIAEAYLQVVPVIGDVSEQIQSQIVAAIEDAVPEVSPEVDSSAGEAGGRAYGTAMLAGLAALGIGAAVASMINSGMEQIDVSNTVIAALNLTEEEAARVNEATTNLYKKGYGESFEAVSGAMRQIVGSVKGAREATSEELEAMARDAINLEKTFGVSAEELNRAVQSALGSGLAGSWEEAVSLITAGFQEFGASGEDWLDTVNEYSGDFVQLGFTGQQAMNFINAGLEAGVQNTDRMADAMRELGIRLRSGEAADELTMLGFDPAKISAQIEAGGQTAQQTIMEVFQALQAQGDAELWTGVVGTMSEDFQNTFANMDLSVQNLNASFAEGIGDLEKFDKTLNSGPSASLETFQRTTEQAFMATLIPLIELVTPPLQAMAEFFSENEQAALLLSIVVGGVLLVAIGLMTVALFGMAAAGWAAMTPFLPIIGIVALVIAAVVALGAVIWLVAENWDAIVAWILSSLIELGNFFTDLGEGIINVFEAIGRFIANYFIGIANTVIDVINFIIGALNMVQFTMPDFLGGATVGINISKISRIPQLADGGTIPARDGGTLAILGEAGRSEVVMDEGKWNALIDQILSGGVAGGGPTVSIQIVQQPGESTEELVQRLEDFYELNSLKPAGYSVA